jgi:hypothetical protein
MALVYRWFFRVALGRIGPPSASNLSASTAVTSTLGRSPHQPCITPQPSFPSLLHSHSDLPQLPKPHSSADIRENLPLHNHRLDLPRRLPCPAYLVPMEQLCEDELDLPHREEAARTRLLDISEPA